MKIMRKLFFALALLVSFAGNAACGFADFGENSVLNHVFRGTAYSNTAPTSYYVALYTTTCQDAAAGTEVSTSGTGYARKGITRATGSWNATNGTNGIVSNTGAITFDPATADWGTVQSWCLLEAVSGATNAVVCADLTAPRTITTGSTPSFGASALTITLD